MKRTALRSLLFFGLCVFATAAHAEVAPEETSCQLSDWAVGDRECEECYPGDNDCTNEARDAGLVEVCSDDDRVVLCEGADRGCSIAHAPGHARLAPLWLSLALCCAALVVLRISRQRRSLSAGPPPPR